MAVQLIQPKNELLNANIYIDYESIYELFKKFGGNPMEFNFFRVILDKYRRIYKLNIVDCIAYCNFEKESFPRCYQTVLQSCGIQFRHVAENHKNCSDLILTTDVITTLYKNPKINKFVILSSGWNITPLLKLIKYENKSADAVFTKPDFDPVVSGYVEHYEYLEDIFNLAPEMAVADEEREWDFLLDQAGLYPSKAAETEKLLFNCSNTWWVATKKQAIRFH